MKVSDALAAAVADAGVTHVFTVMGDANLDFLDALAGRGVTLVHARHEQGAVAMADGYARAGGGIGVCSVTSASGLTQTGTSLATAAAHGSPVLLVAGDAPAADPGRAERFDQHAYGRMLAGAAATILQPPSLPGVVRAAAARLREGPIVLNAPIDVQLQDTGSDTPPRLDAGPPAPPALPEDAALRAAAEALGRAERPLILAGRGAVVAGAADALAALAERLGAPIATTIPALGLCGDHPLSAGVSGSLGDGRATRLLLESDCIYAAGTALTSWVAGGGRIEAHVVRVDADARRLAGTQGTPLLGDVRATTEGILAHLGGGEARPAREIPPRELPGEADFEDGDGNVDPRRALLELDRALPADRRVVTDGGHFAIFATQLMTATDPAHFIFTSDFGAIGQGLATAIGAALASPAPRTTLVVGDGGFLMGVAELETAARYRVPLDLFVMNDDGYGQERHSMRVKGMAAADEAWLPTPDLAALARAAGVDGVRIDAVAGLDGLGDALARADGPLLLDVRINPHVVNPSSAEVARGLRGTK